jgi:putative hydrolase of the HAD superfamily
VRQLTTIGFDADDTLWHNEQFFRRTQERFTAMLAGQADQSAIAHSLLEAERRNISAYGFGIKGFTLSMIESAIEVTKGRVNAATIAEILGAGREMLTHPVEVLPHARETLEKLAGAYRLVLITKGDLFDQERKLAHSWLSDFFNAVEIVSDKRAETYARIFARHGDGSAKSMMVGNSLKSDVLPAIEAGCWGAHVPHEFTWVLDHADAPADLPRFRRLADLGALPAVLAALG